MQGLGRRIAKCGLDLGKLLLLSFQPLPSSTKTHLFPKGDRICNFSQGAYLLLEKGLLHIGDEWPNKSPFERVPRLANGNNFNVHVFPSIPQGDGHPLFTADQMSFHCRVRSGCESCTRGTFIKRISIRTSRVISTRKRVIQTYRWSTKS